MKKFFISSLAFLALFLPYNANAEPCDPLLPFLEENDHCPHEDTSDCVGMTIQANNNEDGNCALSGRLSYACDRLVASRNWSLLAFGDAGYENVSGFQCVSGSFVDLEAFSIDDPNAFLATYDYFVFSYYEVEGRAPTYKRVYFTAIRECAGRECLCLEGETWSIGHEQCVPSETCEAYPALCAGTGGPTSGGTETPPPGGGGPGPGPIGGAEGGGGCMRIASQGDSPSNLAWLGLLLLALALRRLRRPDRVENLRDRS